MINLELTKEGYEGIPATAQTLTEDDLRQWAVGKDVTLIPHAIAALKAAQASIAVTAVALTDDYGTAVENAVTLKVGEELVIIGKHTPEESTADTSWANSADTVVEMNVSADDSRKITVKALAAGSATLTCTSGAGSATVTVTVE